MPGISIILFLGFSALQTRHSLPHNSPMTSLSFIYNCHETDKTIAMGTDQKGPSFLCCSFLCVPKKKSNQERKRKQETASWTELKLWPSFTCVQFLVVCMNSITFVLHSTRYLRIAIGFRTSESPRTQCLPMLFFFSFLTTNPMTTLLNIRALIIELLKIFKIFQR